MKKGLPFSLAEYKERLKKVKEKMVEREVDIFLTHTPENIFYLTGYFTPGYYKYQTCIVPLDREPIMLTRHFEQPNVYHLSWIEESIVYDDIEDHVALTRKALVEAGCEKKRIGVEKDSWFLTPRDLERLVEVMPEATFKDCSGIVESARLIKSPQEIAYIEQAARTTEKAMQAGIDAVVEGATEDEIAGEVWRAMVAAGSEWPGLAPFVTTGPRTALPHGTWAGRVVEKGDVFGFEISGCVHRYSAPMFRCGVLGEPTKQVASMGEATKFALEETIKVMKPGVTSHEVNKACQEAMEEAGWGGVHLHRSAYSVGICFPPDWGEGQIMSLQDGDPTPLQAGMVFHVIPTLLVEGVAGIATTDTVLVTEQGGKALTDFERKLAIKSVRGVKN